MDFYQQTLSNYLDAAGSKTPTPGGGSVSAFVAANAAAMVGMVANLTIDKKGYEASWKLAEKCLSKSSAIIQELKLLTESDIKAFKQLMAAWREKDDQNRYSEAVNYAIEVPLDVCRQCNEILIIAADMAPVGNKSAISDIGVAAFIAAGALNAAMLNVDINLPHVDDAAQAEKIIQEKETLIKSGEEWKIKIITEVRRRL